MFLDLWFMLGFDFTDILFYGEWFDLYHVIA